MAPIYLENQDLERLDPTEAVAFFRRLLWNEAERVNVTRNLINVPMDIYTSDGGIDAYIENAKPIKEDIIPKGNTGFQIKTGKLKPNDCINELHKNRKKKNPLKEGIVKLMNNNSTYILVVFSEIVYKPENTPLDLIKKEFIKYEYPNPKVRVYTLSHLISFTERFPSLISYLKNSYYNATHFQDWAQYKDIDFPKNYFADNKRKEIIEKIREI